MDKLRTKKLFAFSVMELLITVITIAVIAMAFIPVVSKKAIKRMTVRSASSYAYSKCTRFGSDCTMCKRTECVMCNKKCASDEYKTISNCTCTKCSKNFTNCMQCESDKCLVCNDGFYLSGTICDICPKGYECYDGVKSICPINTYAPAGSDECYDCPTGLESAAGSEKCTACGNGSYFSASQKKCVACEAGYKCLLGHKIACNGDLEYQNATKQSTCKTCPAGSYTNAAHTTCTACGAGYYCPGGTRRIQCSYPSGCNKCDPVDGVCTGCSSGTLLPVAGGKTMCGTSL